MNSKEVLAWLEKQGTQHSRNELARYGIVAQRAFGVPMGTLLKMSKQLGIDQKLSLDLWKSGWYEARLLASLVGDAAQVTRAQMNAWAGSFENWADCDTVCFKLFDRAPYAWQVCGVWAASPREFVKRGGFALMACLALHDKGASDEQFLELLPLIEAGASDERNFVKKGVSWALRSIGERTPALHEAALQVCARLVKRSEPSWPWVGKDALRQLGGPKVRLRMARRARAEAKKQMRPRRRTKLLD